MSYIKDTVLLSARTFAGADGATWKECLVAADSAGFEPGQFLMVASMYGTGVHWPSPVMIQRLDAKGVCVWLHPNSPLYELRDGDAVTIWGPNGKGAPVQGEFSVLCDAKGFLLAAPLLRAWPERCKGVYLTGSYHAESAAFAGMRPAPVAAPEELPDAKTLVIALPLEELAHWKAAAAGKAERCVVFTGAKVGCGVGACRGCFIHSGPVSTGIAVCQEGPFLPIETVDYAKDQNFLGHYV